MKSDIQLQRDIAEELAWQPSIRDAEIAVDVTNGVVTLRGFVSTFAQKVAAQRAAEHVSGIRANVDHLEVMVLASQAQSDTELAHRVVSTLAWNSVVPPDAVHSCVKNGWITLDGEVEWQFEREAACCAVRCLAGVKGIDNRIRLHPHAATYDMAQRIRDALRRSAEEDAKHIAVETSGGKVTLRGSVHSWELRQEVERAAWSAAGVSAVDDQMTVAG